jgi:chromate transporter
MLAIKPVVIAVVIQAIVGLLRVVPRTISSFLIIALAAGLFLVGVNELLILFGGGIAILATRRARNFWSLSLAPLIVPLLLQSSNSSSPTTRDLFFSFLKIGSVLYGSGYVLLAFLQGEFVDRHGWLTEQQLLDAVAVGQVTPGPVFSTATFAGYLMGSWSGALAATIGIFLPAFIFVFLTHGLVHWSRKGETTSALLDGLNLAALGLMAGAAWILGRDAIVSVWTLAIAIVALIALVRFRVNSTWLVLAAAIVGLINAATGFI